MSFADFYSNSPQSHAKYQSEEDILSVSTDDELTVDPVQQHYKQHQKIQQQQLQYQQYYCVQQQQQFLPVPLQQSSNPSQVKYKTQMCENWIKRNQCNYGKKCKFAHGVEELKDLLPIGSNVLYKTKSCNQYHTKGYCSYGFRCMFYHDKRDSAQILSENFYSKYLATYQSLQKFDNSNTTTINKIFQDNNNKNDLQKIRNEMNEQQKQQIKRLPIFEQITNVQQLE